MQEKLQRLLLLCAERAATDLHLSAGCAPRLRVHGELEVVEQGEPPLTAEETDAMARALMNDRQWEVYGEQLTLDLAHSGPDGTRFRINAYRERGGTALAVRRLESGFRGLEEWQLPPRLAEVTRLHDGLVLVTGPTGSGKTTTLASLLHIINRERACHILTIEDPIEYLHRNERALVHQRELYTTVPTFAEAVRAALREDPDVILVGEMRDLDTMRTAITAAETGHLVFSTLHTGDAVGSIERMIGVFPADEQKSVRQQLSLVLRQVVTQRLLPRCDARGMVPAVEILKVTNAVANLIRTGRSEQIYSVMETGGEHGMRTLEQELASMVRGGRVARETAYLAAHHPENLGQLLSASAVRGGA
ncbi:MAG: type IV pilus twitching motility protein PilT [Planctomycetota bacterium]|jgi:twitching motility protein PilT